MAETRPVVLVGGAGFIGRALAQRLAATGSPVVVVARGAVTLGTGIAVRAAGDLGAGSDWPKLIAGGRAVVHLAGRAHQPPGSAAAAGWIDAETAMAAAIVRAAGPAGIERIVHVSSIKVHGEASGGGSFRASDAPAPADAYGRAKLRIETAMRAAAGTAMPLVILRPPLVHGPGVRANFLALLRLVDRGLPLPFAGIDNQRSLVCLDNLLDLLVLSLTHAAAPGRVFLLRDGEEISTPALIRQIARQLGRPARLFRFPPSLLRALARLGGQGEAAGRLLESLRIDDTATRVTLGWQPRVTLADGLAATCRWYRSLAPGAAPRRGTAP